jgi:DNA-directed RNA polymerase subunit M/transcription elongation factor TFIIS
MMHAVALRASGSVETVVLKPGPLTRSLKQHYDAKEGKLGYLGALGHPGGAGHDSDGEEQPPKDPRFLHFFGMTAGVAESRHELPGDLSAHCLYGTCFVVMSASDKEPIGTPELLSIDTDEYDLVCVHDFDGGASDTDEEEDAPAEEGPVEEEEEVEELEEKEESKPKKAAAGPARAKRTRKLATVYLQESDTTLTPLQQKCIEYMTAACPTLGAEKVAQIEHGVFKKTVRMMHAEGGDPSWSSASFVSAYTSCFKHIIVNLKQQPEYLKKVETHAWDPDQLAFLTLEEANPARWAALTEAARAKEKQLYDQETSYGVERYCKMCKQMRKCKFWQMQTRSADEPMTSFYKCKTCMSEWHY